MKRDRAQHPMFFPSTHWTQVARATTGEPSSQIDAMGSLLARYYPALLTHLTAVKHTPKDKAEDLLQSFIADRVLRSQLLSHAEERKGRFRTFLLSALDNYAVSQFRKESALKRAPETMVSLDEAEPGIADETGHADVADVAWARVVIKEALTRVQAQCEESGRPQVWEILEGRVLRPTLGLEAPIPYDELVRRLGVRSPGEAHNLLVTAKRMVVRQLGDVVGEYASDTAEVQDEIGDLLKILAQTRAG